MAVVLFAAHTSRCEAGAIVVARRGKNASACSSSARRRAIAGARSLHHQRAAQRGGWVAGTRMAGEARTPLPTPRGASRPCRVLVMQAAMMLSAPCGAARENRRNFSCVGASRPGVMLLPRPWRPEQTARRPDTSGDDPWASCEAR